MHSHYLKEALDLAKIRRGFCAPNPAVGAIVVKNNKILSKGYHFQAGMPHAEVEALKALGNEAKGSTVYVTLEPCCHFGRTPPCTDLLISRGVTSVVYGAEDPNPVVAGLGAKKLKSAGIHCTKQRIPEIDSFYESYNHWRVTGKPFVTAKLAMSLDGKIAGDQGRPIPITGPVLNRMTHQKRKTSDAILTTAKTILNDNPKMNVRLDGEEIKKTLFILDSNCITPENAQIFHTGDKVSIFHTSKAPSKRVEYFKSRGIECILVRSVERGLCLTEVLHHIGKIGIHDLWIEVGAKCLNSFLQLQLLQRLYLYIGSICLGDLSISANCNFINGAKNIRWLPFEQDGCCEITFL